MPLAVHVDARRTGAVGWVGREALPHAPESLHKEIYGVSMFSTIASANSDVFNSVAPSI